ncbi:TPA: hypothetical protein H1005_03595 [archaeon]|nr:hypothetical protein [Candidatus Naiadarchaeales archaeon SRR2090153.bin1042]
MKNKKSSIWFDLIKNDLKALDFDTIVQTIAGFGLMMFILVAFRTKQYSLIIWGLAFFSTTLTAAAIISKLMHRHRRK